MLPAGGGDLQREVAEAAKDETKWLPSLLSDPDHPIPERSIKTGVLGRSMAGMNRMSK